MIHLAAPPKKAKPRRCDQHPLTRHEYLQSARANAKRGQELPHTKLLEIEVISIRSAAIQREKLRKHISENLTNAALAKAYGVAVVTIEKILSYENAGHYV